AVVGPGPVAWAEDAVYGVEDRIKRVVYRDAPPKTFWEPTADVVEEDEPAAETPVVEGAQGGPTFTPASFVPPVASVAGVDDGRWIPVADPRAPGGAPVMFKTIVHPDARRSYAAVAVVAMDLDHLDLRAVAGTVEPESAAVPRSERTGMVPSSQL